MDAIARTNLDAAADDDDDGDLWIRAASGSGSGRGVPVISSYSALQPTPAAPEMPAAAETETTN